MNRPIYFFVFNAIGGGAFQTATVFSWFKTERHEDFSRNPMRMRRE
jgi:hypothetical protein